MSAGCELSLLGVGIRLRGEPQDLSAALAGLGSFAAVAAETSVQSGAEHHELQLRAGGSAGELLADLTRLAVENSPLLCVHAGVVRAAQGSVLIPGSSGLGKTTLVAALVQAGFGYLSDEVLALDRHTAALTGFARPLALAADSWRLLSLAPDLAPAPGQEQLADVALLGSFGQPAPVAEILLAERRPGPAELLPLPRGAAVPAVLSRSFNHYRDPAASFHSVVALVRQARVWRAGYQDAPELAALLAERWLNGSRQH
ncbi:MAG: hypothetical protein ACR2N4_04990 [Jatrophihabitans sp.]